MANVAHAQLILGALRQCRAHAAKHLTSCLVLLLRRWFEDGKMCCPGTAVVLPCVGRALLHCKAECRLHLVCWTATLPAPWAQTLAMVLTWLVRDTPSIAKRRVSLHRVAETAGPWNTSAPGRPQVLDTCHCYMTAEWTPQEYYICNMFFCETH